MTTSADTYFGTPCAIHGHTERYVKSRACVICARKYTAKWRNKNIARIRAYKAQPEIKAKACQRMAVWRKNNLGKAHTTGALKYGRCPIADALARKEHDGTCALCGTTTSGGRGWHVDHVHDGTGDVRGVLCHACNVGLGHFKDSADLLQKAIDYLRRSPKYPAQGT